MLHVCCSIRTLVVLAFALIAQSSIVNASMVVPKAPRQQVTVIHAGPSSNTAVKSYREWKQSKISEAEGRVKNLKETLLKSKGLSLSATEAGLSSNLQTMLDKEEMLFSMAQDLTITDYFVGYLTKQKSVSQAIKEVSTRLSPEEVAELMTAYADNFFSSKPSATGQAPKADSGL